MGGYGESYKKATTSEGAAEALGEDFTTMWPTLATVLRGVDLGSGASNGVGAATIQLFIDGGKLKFCISPKFGNRVAFGVVSDPSDGLDALEREIGAGNFEWKVSKRRRGGSAES